MNHKRKRRKNARAGCLMCKPHKANHADRRTLAEQRLDAADKAEAKALPPPTCPDCSGTGICDCGTCQADDCRCTLCGGTGVYS